MSLRNARKNAEDAIREIRKYSPSNDRHALLRRVLIADGAAPKELSNFVLDLQSMIDGGIFTNDFIEKLKEFSSTNDANEKNSINNLIKETVRITVPSRGSIDNQIFPYLNSKSIYEDIENSENNLLTLDKGNPSPNEIADDGKSFKSPNKEQTSLSVIEVLNPKISINARETDATSIFLSLIPSLELSKCVPYINVSLTNESEFKQNNQNLSGLSLVSFLVGRDTSQNELTSLDRFSHLSINSSSETTSLEKSAASMELFTS